MLTNAYKIPIYAIQWCKAENLDDVISIQKKNEEYEQRYNVE